MDGIDISQGIDPVPAFYDVDRGIYVFKVDGKDYGFYIRELPFTLKKYSADKALILKHGTCQIESVYG